MKMLLAAVAFIAIAGSLIAGPLNSREVAERVTEFCSAKTDEARRKVILGELQAQPQSALYAILKEKAAVVEMRPYVCRLVAELKHERAWEILSPHFDTPEQPDIVRALFAVSTPKVLAQLRSRWAAAKPDEPLFDQLTDGFGSAALGSEDLDAFAALLSDASRGEAARKIMGAQLDKPSDDAAALKKAWDELKAKWAVYGRSFAIKGRALLSSAKFVGKARRIRENVMMGKSSGVSFTDLAKFQKVNHTVTLRFLIVDGSGFTIGYGSSQGWWNCKQAGDKLRIMAGDHTEFEFDLIKNGWNEYTLTVTMDKSEPNVVNSRTVTFAVNGKSCQLMSLNGELLEVFARTTDGTAVVGGWDIRAD